MKKSNVSPGLYTAISGILVLVPLSFIIAWIQAYNLSDIQSERIKIYNSYFPGFISNTNVLVIISVLFCISAIVISAISYQHKNAFLKIISILITLLAVLIAAFNIFSLL